MDLLERMHTHYVNPKISISASYGELTRSNFDVGFRSLSKNGQDIHKITRDISVSIQEFNHGKLTNTLFNSGQVLCLEYADADIAPYISDYIEIRYVIQGSLVVSIDKQYVTFNQDDVCFINSIAVHRELIDQSNCTILNISVDRDFFNQSIIGSIALSPMQTFLRSNVLQYGEQSAYLKVTPNNPMTNEDIKWYLFNLFRENIDQRAGFREISKGYLLRLIDALSTSCKYHFSEDMTNTYYKKLFESISVFMSDHISSISLQALVNEFHFQPNYYSILIKRFTGLSYTNYLVQLRINRSKLLLESTNLSIEEIMFLIGYHNKGFFYQKFYEATGTNPSKYRKFNLTKNAP